MKILFQGDSVTDAGRDRSNPADLGEGYPKFASAMIQDSYPDLDFEFVDLGISGNRTEHLVARLEADFIEVQPDIVSIMIGINDVWHHYAFEFVETTDEQFEKNYRTVLDAIKSRTSARILMIQPFLLETVDPAKQELCEELARKQQIIRKLADEYADVYLPLDEVLHTETDEKPAYYSADGVHPTPDGACFIGEAYLRAVAPLIELLSKEDR
jgi:lysophospholipase L1-like esterase